MAPGNKISVRERDGVAVLMQLGTMCVGLGMLALFAIVWARGVAFAAVPVALGVGGAVWGFYLRSFVPVSRAVGPDGEAFHRSFARLMMFAAFYPGGIALITGMAIATLRGGK